MTRNIAKNDLLKIGSVTNPLYLKRSSKGIQGDLLNMDMLFWCLAKSDFISVRQVIFSKVPEKHGHV